MNKSYRILTGFLLVALVAAPNMALATTTFSLQQSSSGISGYDRTYDVMATTDSELGAMEMIIDTLLPGSIYQNYSGIPTAADDPYEPFASYVTFNSSIGANPTQTVVLGEAVDLGGGPGATFDANNIDISWVPEPGQHFSNNTFQIGRFTLADWAEASYTITGFEGSLGVQGTPIQGTITPLNPVPSPSLSMVELLVGAPTGYKTYDFFVDITTTMGAMELILETHHPDIYQNYSGIPTAADNPYEAFASYVTIGPSGPNEPQTLVLGEAVDLGGGPGATFDTQNIDITWVSTPGTMTGPGLQQIARVTLHEKAEATYSLMGWQTGNDTPDTLSGTIDSLLTVSIVEAPGAPPGYTAYDFIADVSTDMGPLELILDTDTPGDIYQNNTGDDPDVGAEEFDTYVTIGGGPDPAQTQVLGGAVELGGGVSETFDTQNIDIAWMPTGGNMTGRGVFQIARIVVDNSASGSWSLIGWQAGINDDVALTITGTITGGEIMFFPGDVNGDGYIDGNDLSIIINNWGKSGLGWPGGDVNGNGVVDGSDYTAVLSNWAPAEPPEAAGVPEPLTMLVLALGGGLALLRRRVNFVERRKEDKQT